MIPIYNYMKYIRVEYDIFKRINFLYLTMLTHMPIFKQTSGLT